MASVSEVESKPSTSTCPEISDKDIEAIFAKGKRHYICQETILAYKSFGDVCTKLSAKYGQTANECGEAYLYYGKSLLDIARMENGVLGNALKAGPAVEEDDEEDLPNQEGPSIKDIPDDERSQVRQDVKEALKVAPIEPDFTLPSTEDNEKKEEAMEEEGSGSTTEGKEKKEEAMEEEGSGVVDAKEEKEGEVMKDGEEKSKEGADLESLPISPESEKTEDDADNDDDADADDDDVNDDDDTEAENTETAEDDGTEEGKSDEHPEDVPDMQLAWEMLELARLIFARQEGKEMKLKQAEANNTLGEISMELEHYAEAVGDFSECLRLQDPVLDADDRLRAETHYNLGLSYTLDKHYEKAIEHFKKAIKSIECRIANIEKKIEEEQNKKGKEKVEADSPLASWRKEVEELKDLLPDMAAKIEDAEETKRSADITARAVKEIAKEFMGSASSAFDAPTMHEEKSSNGFDTPTINEDGTPQEKKNQASDISNLVRKKLEPSDISHLVKKVEPSDISHLVKKRKKEDDSEGDEMETKKARQTEECKEDTKKECKEETTDQKPAVEKPAVEEVMETA